MHLFLDFDGVLHPEPCYDRSRLFCQLPLFEAVLKDFPDVNIIISSTWRESLTLKELMAFFSDDIGRRIVGVTPRFEDVQDEESFGRYVRQDEIVAWMRKNEPQNSEHWIALDDKHWHFKPFEKRLIKCANWKGFTEVEAEQLREKLLAHDS